MNTESFSDFASGRACNYAESIAKRRRDVCALNKYARFVINLNADGTTTLTDNRLAAKVVPLIVVTGNITNNLGHTYPCSLLEIGYKRARPYKRVHFSRNKVLIWGRDPTPQLAEGQIALVYPEILDCLEAILIETRQKWRNRSAWWANGRLVERGVQITIDKADTWLHREFLRENVRYFQSCWFPRFSRWINRRLKYTNTYRSFPGPSAQKAIDSIMGSEYAKSPVLLEALLRSLEKRSIIEGALIQKNVSHHLSSAEVPFVFSEEGWIKLASPKNFFIWHTLDQPQQLKGSHAQRCARFEVLFDRARERLLEPYNEPAWQEVQLTKEQDNDPNYCPF